jgi:hypothetical protein
LGKDEDHMPIGVDRVGALYLQGLQYDVDDLSSSVGYICLHAQEDLLSAAAQTETAEGLLVIKGLKEQVNKADAAIHKLQEQVEAVKLDLAAREEAVAAVVAEKEAFAAEASEAQSRIVALHQELSQAKTACAEVCGAVWAPFISFCVIVVRLVSVNASCRALLIACCRNKRTEPCEMHFRI